MLGPRNASKDFKLNMMELSKNEKDVFLMGSYS